MEWHQLPPAKKRAYLSRQMAEIQRAKALIERFEKVTQKWLLRVSDGQKNAPGQKAKSA